MTMSLVQLQKSILSRHPITPGDPIFDLAKWMNAKNETISKFHREAFNKYFQQLTTIEKALFISLTKQIAPLTRLRFFECTTGIVINYQELESPETPFKNFPKLIDLLLQPSSEATVGHYLLVELYMQRFRQLKFRKDGNPANMNELDELVKVFISLSLPWKALYNRKPMALTHIFEVLDTPTYDLNLKQALQDHMKKLSNEEKKLCNVLSERIMNGNCTAQEAGSFLSAVLKRPLVSIDENGNLTPFRDLNNSQTIYLAPPIYIGTEAGSYYPLERIDRKPSKFSEEKENRYLEVYSEHYMSTIYDYICQRLLEDEVSDELRYWFSTRLKCFNGNSGGLLEKFGLLFDSATSLTPEEMLRDKYKLLEHSIKHLDEKLLKIVSTEKSNEISAQEEIYRRKKKILDEKVLVKWQQILEYKLVTVWALIVNEWASTERALQREYDDKHGRTWFGKTKYPTDKKTGYLTYRYESITLKDNKEEIIEKVLTRNSSGIRTDIKGVYLSKATGNVTEKMSVEETIEYDIFIKKLRKYLSHKYDAIAQGLKQDEKGVLKLDSKRDTSVARMERIYKETETAYLENMKEIREIEEQVRSIPENIKNKIISVIQDCYQKVFLPQQGENRISYNVIAHRDAFVSSLLQEWDFKKDNNENEELIISPIDWTCHCFSYRFADGKSYQVTPIAYLILLHFKVDAYIFGDAPFVDRNKQLQLFCATLIRHGGRLHEMLYTPHEQELMIPSDSQPITMQESIRPEKSFTHTFTGLKLPEEISAEEKYNKESNYEYTIHIYSFSSVLCQIFQQADKKYSLFSLILKTNNMRLLHLIFLYFQADIMDKSSFEQTKFYLEKPDEECYKWGTLHKATFLAYFRVFSILMHMEKPASFAQRDFYNRTPAELLIQAIPAERRKSFIFKDVEESYNPEIEVPAYQCVLTLEDSATQSNTILIEKRGQMLWCSWKIFNKDLKRFDPNWASLPWDEILSKAKLKPQVELTAALLRKLTPFILKELKAKDYPNNLHPVCPFLSDGELEEGKLYILLEPKIKKLAYCIKQAGKVKKGVLLNTVLDEDVINEIIENPALLQTQCYKEKILVSLSTGKDAVTLPLKEYQCQEGINVLYTLNQIHENGNFNFPPESEFANQTSEHIKKIKLEINDTSRKLHRVFKALQNKFLLLQTQANRSLPVRILSDYNEQDHEETIHEIVSVKSQMQEQEESKRSLAIVAISAFFTKITGEDGYLITAIVEESASGKLNNSAKLKNSAKFFEEILKNTHEALQNINYSQGVLSGALNEITKDLGEMIRINTEISQQKQSLLDAQEEELRSTKEEIMKLKKELELKNTQKTATSHTAPCLFKSHKEESSQNQIIDSSSFNASHSLRSFDKITKKPKKTYLNPNRFDLLSQTKEEAKEETENFLERKRELEKRGII